MNYFSSNIKILRERQQKKKAAIAAAIGVHPTYISKLEGRTYNPASSMLIDFSEHFKISIDDLVTTDLSRLPENVLMDLQIAYILKKQKLKAFNNRRGVAA